MHLVVFNAGRTALHDGSELSEASWKAVCAVVFLLVPGAMYQPYIVVWDDAGYDSLSHYSYGWSIDRAAETAEVLCGSLGGGGSLLDICATRLFDVFTTSLYKSCRMSQ